jgi:hypothetical protein
LLPGQNEFEPQETVLTHPSTMTLRPSCHPNPRSVESSLA